MVIKHDSRLAPRLQDAAGFLQTPCGVGAVMHDAIGIRYVESVVRERQIFGICDVQVRSEAREFAPSPGTVERRCRKSSAGCQCPAFQPLHVVSPHSNPDLEYSEATRGSETGKLWDVRLQRVSSLRMG